MKSIPNIPIIYPNRFPKDFSNNVNGWGFSKEEIIKNKGKILTLDIDFGNFCTLNCPHCFRRNNKVDYGPQKLLGYDDLVQVIKEAKKLGLKSVKFLGAGEPFQNERFIEFLRFLNSIDVIPAIFTKGHVIGDNKEVKRWNAHYGITTGEQLVKELDRLNVSILLGFNSFDNHVQDKMVGSIEGYTQKRNRALELLVKRGFNKHNPTRLCIAANPVTKENYNEVFDIYKWARVRNLYVIICPTMVSGRCGEKKAWKKVNPSFEKLVDLYVKIYRFNIEKGIQTLEQIKTEGISPYAGAHPCNQVACGMYITLTGTVLRCPGDDTAVFGSVWDKPLKEIWEHSENYKRRGTFNCGCPPKIGKSIPVTLFTEVMRRLTKE